MALFERRSSRAGLQETESTLSDNDNRPSGDQRRSQPASNDDVDGSSYRSTDVSDLMPSFSHRISLSRSSNHSSASKPDSGQPLRTSALHNFPFLPQSLNPNSSSRDSSAKNSSSSLQDLKEESEAEAEAHVEVRPTSTASRLVARISQHFEPRPPSAQPLNAQGDFPVYPNQSYAVLQSQVYPPPYLPLRSRSSYPSQTLPDRQRGTSQVQAPRTAGNTPISSPGLFSARSSRSSPPPAWDDDARLGSPYLHPTHLQPPKETHTVEVERDLQTGNKLINDYEVLGELGRGEHGKVKLGRHLPTGQKVAIKIVQRYSKRRRLGKLGNPEDKVKKEVAILKKARHPNVVSLLEVIDDPERQKVYIVLEYVEKGEIIWRTKGLRPIVQVDKHRLEQEKQGIPESPSFLEMSQLFMRNSMKQRSGRRKYKAGTSQRQPAAPFWSLELGAESEEESGPELTLARTISLSQAASEHGGDVHSSPSHSYVSQSSDFERRMRDATLEAAMEGTMFGPYASDFPVERRFSTASSSRSAATPEWEYASGDDDMSYVPCLTISEARNAFRDAVLGLEYLHYQGIIHRDIKPANLLVTSNHRVKISDFGVSYLGRPIRDDEIEQVTETDATELDDARELSKTVGTPAFYAPELCYTGDDFVEAIGKVPKITGAIDIWSLGVTLYGMIFGRLPFVSDDEFSMFQTIVKNELFIPTKRLKPVEVGFDRNSGMAMNSNKRMEDELAYEDLDEEIRDLLRRLLTKDPTKRITIKEIKHHPWVLRGLSRPDAWIEETDPGYQSKGKRIEVSTEEVTTAVTKSFLERMKSNLTKWGGYISGNRPNRNRAHSNAGTSDPLPSSPFRDLREGRRSSLRGDEDSIVRALKAGRESEHPLSQSVVASPEVPMESQTSYFDQVTKRTADEATPRPYSLNRAASVFSSTESTKTIRPSAAGGSYFPHQPYAVPAPHPHDTTGSSTISGLFGGAGHRLGKTSQSDGEPHVDKSGSDRASAEGDTHAEPSVALSVESATGQVQNPIPWEGEEPADRNPRSGGRSHRRSRSHQLQRQTSMEEPYPTSPGNTSSRPISIGWENSLYDRHARGGFESQQSSNASLFSGHEFLSGQGAQDTGPRDHNQDMSSRGGGERGLSPSPPSAAMISSSSAEDFGSNISQSASHPSIPSVVSGATSVSGDGLHTYFNNKSGREKEVEHQSPVVSDIFRTTETIKPETYHHAHADAQPDRYHHRADDDGEEEDDEDEGLVIGKRSSVKRTPSNIGRNPL